MSGLEFIPTTVDGIDWSPIQIDKNGYQFWQTGYRGCCLELVGSNDDWALNLNGRDLGFIRVYIRAQALGKTQFRALSRAAIKNADACLNAPMVSTLRAISGQ